ncbi:MAG TPA: hypothetical protein VEC02_08015 [Nitrososphaerales archaeon]|nr:hypothetical protein [Nitrososphaerales archaeon]
MEERRESALIGSLVTMLVCSLLGAVAYELNGGIRNLGVAAIVYACAIVGVISLIVFILALIGRI